MRVKGTYARTERRGKKKRKKEMTSPQSAFGHGVDGFRIKEAGPPPS